MAHVLRVAPGHLHDFGSHLDLLASPLLPTASARFADQKRDLVTRPTLVGRTAENLSRHGEQRGVVVETCARVAAHLGQRFAEVGIRFGGDFESKDVPFEIRVARILRQVARPVPGDEILDLSNGSSPRDLEPSVLAFRGGNARQLPSGRPAHGPVAKRLFERRQRLERFGHTQTFFGPSWLVSEEPFDVLRKCAEA
jgi:hypothetical protein